VESLSPCEVHVWLAWTRAIDEDTARERYLGLLDDEERERHGRFVFARDRHTFLVAHALVRETLSRYADVPPERWRFRANEYGRPSIAEPGEGARLRFNLSHTEGLAACAVTLDRELGVDVEYLDRRGETVALADRFFAPAEARALRALAEGEQRGRFFAYWTLKEAYIKARGMGLAIPLDQFAFDVDATGVKGVTIDTRLGDDASRWQFAQFAVGEHHLAAVAIDRGGGDDLAVITREGVNLRVP